MMDGYADFTQAHTEVPWRSMRNRMAHGYFDINLDVVWETTQECARTPTMKTVTTKGSNHERMWLAAEPLDMRAGADRLLARVVQVFGAVTATCSPTRVAYASSCSCTTASAYGAPRGD